MTICYNIIIVIIIDIEDNIWEDWVYGHHD